MTRLLGGRLIQIAVTLIVLSACAYAVIGLMPGDPIDIAIASDPRLTAEDAARLRALHGIDRPLLARYLAWAGGVLHGEFGYSRLYAQPVAQVLWPALASTLRLLGLTLLLAASIGIGLGLLAATRRGTLTDAAVNGFAFAAMAVPTFWLGILLIIAFAVELGWLPAGGAETPSAIVLPVVTLAVANLAAYTRHTRSAMSEALRELYVRTARAKGCTGAQVVFRHALPNAAVPVITLMALDAGALVSGALVTETVFARPGMGKLIYDAVMGADYNLALLALLLAALVTMLATLAADLAQIAIDPRTARLARA